MTSHPSLAYLISQYPKVSHTFIQRELAELRAMGFTIQVASINAPDRPPEKLTAAERAEAATTWFVKRQGVAGALTALVATAVTCPLGLWRGFRAALNLAGPDPRRVAKHLAYWVEAAMIGRWMQRRGVNHLHVHFATPAAAVGLLVKAIFGTGFSFTVHGPDEFYDAPGYSLAEKIQAADFVVCISHYARSQVEKLSALSEWGKFEVCRLGVDPAQFTFSERPADPVFFRLLCVGRLVSAKGQAVLLEALDLLRKRGRQPTLVYVGDGPDRAALEERTRALDLTDSVHFVGAVNQDHILVWYAQSDAFVLPSFAEGLPVVLMEAMATGLPVVTTQITGTPELIRDGEHGLLVAAADREGLADAIERLMDNPELRHRLALAGRAKVLAEYVQNTNTATLAAVFRKRLG